MYPRDGNTLCLSESGHQIKSFLANYHDTSFCHWVFVISLIYFSAFGVASYFWILTFVAYELLKGIRKLCCELLDLKDSVENLCGNTRAKYLAFLRYCRLSYIFWLHIDQCNVFSRISEFVCSFFSLTVRLRIWHQGLTSILLLVLTSQWISYLWLNSWL